jgi:hypothetical protein
MIRVLFILVFQFITLFSLCQSRYISATTKKIVYSRDGGKCQCCGSFQNLEFDHIVPYSCGGNGNASNIQLLCLKCNRSKSNSCYCKIHSKKVGLNCCDSKSPTNNSIKRSYSSTSNQCSGTTKKGLRCRNRTTNPSGRCYLH